MKHFSWKAYHEILPIRWNLHKKKVTDQFLCPICESKTETLIHTLWECPAARAVWGEEKSPLMKWYANFPSVEELWVRRGGPSAKKQQGAVCYNVEKPLATA